MDLNEILHNIDSYFDNTPKEHIEKLIKKHSIRTPNDVYADDFFSAFNCAYYMLCDNPQPHYLSIQIELPNICEQSLFYDSLNNGNDAESQKMIIGPESTFYTLNKSNDCPKAA